MQRKKLVLSGLMIFVIFISSFGTVITASAQTSSHKELVAIKVDKHGRLTDSHGKKRDWRLFVFTYFDSSGKKPLPLGHARKRSKVMFIDAKLLKIDPFMDKKSAAYKKLRAYMRAEKKHHPNKRGPRKKTGTKNTSDSPATSKTEAGQTPPAATNIPVSKLEPSPAPTVAPAQGVTTEEGAEQSIETWFGGNFAGMSFLLLALACLILLYVQAFWQVRAFSKRSKTSSPSPRVKKPARTVTTINPVGAKTVGTPNTFVFTGSQNLRIWWNAYLHKDTVLARLLARITEKFRQRKQRREAKRRRPGSILNIL